MAQWGVELASNDPALLSFLAKYGKELSWSVVEVEGKYYLLSTNFQGLTSPEDVSQNADNLLFLLNGIVKLKFKYAHLNRAASVVSFDDHGHIIRTTTPRDVPTRINVSAGEPYFQNAEAQHLSSMDIWLRAQNNSTVEEALQYYSNQHNWFNLYKVYETIKKDTTRLEEKRAIPRGSFDKWTRGRKVDFEYSANKARHSSLGYHPPKAGVRIVYMSLQEADEFVMDIFFLWLQSK